MKKLITVLFILINIIVSAQTVKFEGTKFTIKHSDLTFYLDSDTNTYISVQTISLAKAKKIDGDRDDKWHKEKPFGPYKKEYYVHSGYDLGHLSPAHITSYDDSLQYHSFSFFNQAPQLAEFNRGKWKSLEASVEKLILAGKSRAIIITGVLYENEKKVYLGNGRIKIPFVYYKILIINKTTKAWIGSNINGTITETTIQSILDIAKKNGNALNITILN